MAILSEGVVVAATALLVFTDKQQTLVSSLRQVLEGVKRQGLGK